MTATERALRAPENNPTAPEPTGPEQLTQAQEDRAFEGLPYARAREQALRRFEQTYVEAQLRASGGNISAAARRAGMDRSNFKRLLRKYRRDAVADPGPDDDLAIG